MCNTCYILGYLRLSKELSGSVVLKTETSRFKESKDIAFGLLCSCRVQHLLKVATLYVFRSKQDLPKGVYIVVIAPKRTNEKKMVIEIIIDNSIGIEFMTA